MNNVRKSEKISLPSVRPANVAHSALPHGICDHPSDEYRLISCSGGSTLRRVLLKEVDSDGEMDSPYGRDNSRGYDVHYREHLASLFLTVRFTNQHAAHSADQRGRDWSVTLEIELLTRATALTPIRARTSCRTTPFFHICPQCSALSPSRTPQPQH